MTESPALKRIDLPVTGMSCASCASHIETALAELNGVASVLVNFAAETATVVYDPSKLKLTDLTRTATASLFPVLPCQFRA
jgi:Cu+-exporting ATPase